MHMDESDIASGRRTGERILAGLIALPASAYACLMLLGLARGFDPLSATLGAVAATAALLAGWFALRGCLVESRRAMKRVILGGVILGGVGFIAGFVGPILLRPDANQGPLLGIFITGPLGFVVGAAAGWISTRFRGRGA